MNKIILLVTAFILIVVGALYFSKSNKEIELRAHVEAQQEVNKAFFDKMWKIVKEQAGVASRYKEDFKDVYKAIMTERYDNARGGALFSWIQEHNPNFDSRLYLKIQQSVEAQRDAFFIEQEKLISIAKTHEVYISTFPNTLFLFRREPIDIVTITSERTEQAFETGKEELKPLFD